MIKKNRKSLFVLLTPYPDFHNLYDARVCSEEWFRPILNKNCNAYVIRKKQIVRHQDYLFGIQEIVKNNKNASIFDSFSLMCPSNQKKCYSYDLESKVRLYDDHHPNGIAANLIIDKLMEI